MRCLMCGKVIGSDNLKELFLSEDLICGNCRKEWRKIEYHWKIEGVNAYAPYLYNEAFSSCLIQYKECMDEALKDVFFAEVKKKLHRKYKGYTLCLMPSSVSKRKERGFDHLQGMYASLNLPMCSPFEKVVEEEQKSLSAGERRAYFGNLCLKEDAVLPKKLVLADDTITTGTTIRSALACLRGMPVKVEILSVSVNAKWLKQPLDTNVIKLSYFSE